MANNKIFVKKKRSNYIYNMLLNLSPEALSFSLFSYNSKSEYDSLLSRAK
jgi:hypothetical protein